MRLANRVKKLEALAPPVRPGKQLPSDPVAFGRAFVAGEFTVEDIDPTHPDHMGWAVRCSAFLATLLPEHQAYLRQERERHPRAYPDELLLPASDEQILAKMDEVMRRG